MTHEGTLGRPPLVRHGAAWMVLALLIVALLGPVYAAGLETAKTSARSPME